MGYTINSCKQIVVMEGNTRREIKEVWYCNNASLTNKVWPCITELREAYVVALSTNGQSYDISSTAYTVDQNHVPSVTLLPGYKYAVKGTIYIYDNAMNHVDTITDCYFHYETVADTGLSGDGLYTTLDETHVVGDTFGSRTDSNGTSNTYYNYWTCTADPGTDRGMTMQAYYDTGTYGPVQFNYLFDPNYATPFVFKRATITEGLVLADQNINSYNGQHVYSSGMNLQYGQHITVYPKLYQHAHADGWNDSSLTNWENISTPTVVISDPDSAFTITNNNNGSYDITPAVMDGNLHEITFTSGNITADLEITTLPDVSYLVKIGNTTVTGTEYSITPDITLDTSKTINVYKDTTYPPSFGNDTIYNTNVSMTSSNGTIATCSGRVITPGEPGTASITVTVDGVALPAFTVTVPNTVPTIYYKVSSVATEPTNTQYYDYETAQQVTANSSFERDTESTTGTVYAKVKFATDTQMNNLRTVYIDTDGESYIPGYYVNGNPGEIRVEMSGDSEWILSFTKPGTSSSHTFAVQLPVYAWWGNEGIDGYIGTIELTFDC